MQRSSWAFWLITALVLTPILSVFANTTEIYRYTYGTSSTATTGTGLGGGSNHVSSSQYAGMIWSAPTTTQINKVVVPWQRTNGDTNGSITMHMYEYLSDSEVGTLIATSSPVSLTSICVDGETNCSDDGSDYHHNGTAFNVEFLFPSDISVTQNEKYFLIAKRSTSGSTLYAYHNNNAQASGNTWVRCSTALNDCTTADNDDFYGYILFDQFQNQPYITVSEDIISTTTWSGTKPYVVFGDVEIESGITLTIEPGVSVKFNTASSSSLTISGIFIATGTPEAGQIAMTSLNHDYIEDTNQNGTSTTPAVGDWGGIIIESGGVANLTNTIVRYAGATSTYSSQIYNNGGTLNLIDSRIVYGTTNGVKSSSGSTIIEGTELAYHDNGLYISGGIVIASDGNIIHHNTSYGIFNNTSTTIDAEDNFWGHDSGPYNASNNASGTGNSVSDYVDFSPWTEGVHYTFGYSSVFDGEIRWDGSTQFADQWDAAIDTWNALGSINIATDTIFTTSNLTISDVNDGDLSWVGQWTPNIGPDDIVFNEYYLQYDSNEEIQNTVTHELGHALGLDHSYTGNILYYRQSSQTILGEQDEVDYYYLWP